MGKWKRFVIPVLASTFLFLFPCVCSASPLLGVHPLDTAYFSADVIGCKDGSKAFTRDRLNDNFCDCFDGTDEPGTSACPAAKFYCSNAGSAPQFIYSSHVNDHFCDCCDGSDEYDSGVRCPNTCIMGGSVRHNVELHKSTGSKQHQNGVKERSSSVTLQDLMQKLEGLKMIAVLEGLLVCFLVVLWICHRHPRSRRRRAR